MPRFTRPNQVPVASFNLRTVGPLTTKEALSQCGGKAYRACFGDSEPDATLDKDPCPECALYSVVEWAYTMKRDANGAKQGYVYARCRAYPKQHRWGFRGPKASPPTPPEFITQPKEPPTMPDFAQPTTPAANPIEAWIQGIIGTRLDTAEGKILALAKEISERTPLTVTLKVETEARTYIIEGLRHPLVDELVERFALGERTFMLVGPAGTGKTTIARQVAAILEAKRVTIIACSEDMRRETFIGHKAYNVQEGTTPYQASALVEDLRTVGISVTILEEVDAASPNALLTINALENGFLPTPDCDAMPTHARPVDHVLIATANTWGNAGSTQYVGRNQLDAATLDRYTTLFVDYDPTLEKALVNDADVYKALTDLRRRVTSGGLRKVVSTRLGRRVVTARKLKANVGKSAKEVLHMTLKASGWTDAEMGRAVQE